MPKLVLEPLQPEEERKKKKKKKPKKPVEAPEDNYFTGRQARIDEVNRIAQLSADAQGGGAAVEIRGARRRRSRP